MDERGQAAGEVDWAAVKALYEAGEVPVHRICSDHGITPAQLRRRYLAEGWRIRPRVAHPGPPGVPRRPIELAIENVLRLIAVQARRLAAAPGRAPAEELLALTGLGKAAEGLMREDRSQQRSPQGGGSMSFQKAAAGGGFATPEEARAADVAFMRAEIKRRIAILRRSAGLDGADRPAGGQ